jgi:beta-glucosidase
MQVMLGPGVNLARVPVGGRNFEYLGEDPCLAGRMAAAEVRGIQGEGVVACTKHWVDNNQEGPAHNGRLITSSVVSDRANFEMYYAPFEAAVRAGTGAVMCSYNLINGTYSCENAQTLTGHLKGVLNFSGWVVSDWGADHGSVTSLNAGMDQTMSGGFNNVTVKSILAGDVPPARVDDALTRILTPLFTVGVFDRNDYGNATDDVRSKAHDDLNMLFATSSIVLLKNDDGILPLNVGQDPPKLTSIGVVGDDQNVKGGGSGSVWSTHIVTPTEGLISLLTTGTHANHNARRYTAAATPPLGEASTHALPDECPADGDISWRNRSIQGYDLGPPPHTGYPTLNASACCALCSVTPGCAFWSWNSGSPGSCYPKSDAAAGHYSYGMKGYDAGACPVHPPIPPPPVSQCSQKLGTSGIVVCNHSVTYASCGMGQCDQSLCTTVVTAQDIEDAVKVAQMTDVVVVNVAVTSTEGYDRDNLTLGVMQDRLVSAVAAANPNTIVVVRCPGAVLMPWASEVKAILVQFLPGEQSGNALAAVLTGAADPGGRLPLSFPAAESQSWLKSKAQYPGLEQPGTAMPRYIATYSEELLMGYRWFDDGDEEPAFAFGSGMSFTNFTVTCPPSSISSVGATCTVTNTGERPGSTVVQLYISYPSDAGEPPQQLRDFAKVHLEAGASATVELNISLRDRSVWDEATSGWVAVRGRFGVTVGQSSRDADAVKGSFTV